MASRADKLKERLGANMAESMGAGAGGETPRVEAASPGSTGLVASKHDGVKPLREARLIRLTSIVRDPDQPRQIFDAEALNRLAESLVARGQLQPIRVRWNQELGKYLIIAGERRWRAATLAGMESLQAIVAEQELTASEILQEQLVENCLREDLKPVEQAQAFRALMDTNGWSARRVADELHMANSTVIKALALLELDPVVQEQVESGRLAPTAAYEVSKLDKPDQVKVAGRIVSEGLTRDQATAAVREKSGRPAKGSSKISRQPSSGVGTDRTEYRLEDGTTVIISGPAASAGPGAVVTALEAAIGLARLEGGREKAA